MREEIALLLEAAGIPYRNSVVYLWSRGWTIAFIHGRVAFISDGVFGEDILSHEHALSLILEAQSCSKS